MSRSLGVARVLVLAFGVTMLLAGLAIFAFGGGAAVISGFWVGGLGIACIVGALIERVRYRSEAVDRDGTPAGPAGGEPPGTRLEPRFRRSDEVFTDPTTAQVMRVWIDPSNGERRYIAED